MPLASYETEQQNSENYTRLDSGNFLVTEEFSEEVRKELLLESRYLLNEISSHIPDAAMLYEESGQSGQFEIQSLGEMPDTEIGIRISKASDENHDGTLSIFRSAYRNSSEDNPAITVSFGPDGTLVTGESITSRGEDATPLSEAEAVAFAREVMKKVQDSLPPAEN